MQVLARAGWCCQACRVRRRLAVHHVVKRSQGGSDFDLDQLVALCRWCHDQTDAPYERGRLVVTALGAGQFTFEVVQQAARGSSAARVPTFAHVGKTDARDVGRGPDWDHREQPEQSTVTTASGIVTTSIGQRDQAPGRSESS